MSQRIHHELGLQPADPQGTIIAAGPIVGGSGMMRRRVVLRLIPYQSITEDHQWIIHEQQFDHDGNPMREYHNGDYFDDESKAFAGFVRRLQRMGESALNVPIEDMVPRHLTLS